MNLYLYIPYSSNHPDYVFKNLVTTELRRYIITNSFEKDYVFMKDAFFKRLTTHTINYAASKLIKWFDSIKYSDRMKMIFKQKASVSCANTQTNQSIKGNPENLILYKTQYDSKFQNINISKVIIEEIDNKIRKTKDGKVKEFLKNVRPVV